MAGACVAISLAASPSVQLGVPVAITVSESIVVSDSPLGVPPADVPVSESIGVTDTPGVFPAASVPVSESITVTDAPEIVLGTAPVVITVLEAITVTDSPEASVPIITVNSTSDTDDGICDLSHCSLREAINVANASPRFDVIEFRIPDTDPGRDAITGVFTIRPGSSLPFVDEREPVSIDAYTQPGAGPNTLATGNDAVLLIELDGSLAGSFANGLNLVGSTTLRGLVINRFGGDAVRIWGDDKHIVQGNFIGTDPTGTLDLGNGTGIRFIGSSANGTFGSTTPEARNLISGNTGAAVIIRGVGSTGNLVQGNYIGTDASGTSALGNGGGVTVLSGANTVGGATPGARNLVSGNSGDGLLVSGSDNLVQGNFIGTDVTGGSALGNGGTGLSLFGSNNVIGGTADGEGNVISANRTGVFVSSGWGNVALGNRIGTDVTGTIALGNATEGVTVRAPDTVIGGTADGAGNVISGNGVRGVLVTDATSAGTRVEGNLIGTQADGVSPLGNGLQGVEIGGLSIPTDVTVGGTGDSQGNTIAFNGSDGVGVGSGTGITILGNSIFSNTDLGIDLGNNGVTLNDLGDVDASPNLLQNFPLLSSAIVITASIEGSLNSTPDTRFHIEFFSNTSCDPSGYGEGERFIGSTAVTTDAGGDASIVAVLAAGVVAGQLVTATATDPGNNTSEFSRCVKVTQQPETDLSVTKSDSPDPVFVGQRVTYTIDVTNGGPQDATGVTLTDTLPVGVSFDSASAGCVEALGVVTCDLGTVASGAGASVQIIIIADTVGTLTNTATASSDQLDPNTANDTAIETTAVIPTADLRTTKTDSSDPATAGENLTYTVTVTNDGPQDATVATITDTLPSDVSFVSASAGCAESGGTVTCALGTIALGASVVVEIVVSPTTPGTIINVADASSDVHDPDPTNNRGSESTSVVPATSFTVNTTDNQDDTVCDVNHCSLKEAIKAANANADQDFIHFNIPTSAPGYDATTGVYTIAAATFPLIERGGVTIDGYTQPGASPNTLAVGNNAVLVIELAGTGGFSGGLTIGGGSFPLDGPVTIRGLVINRFGGDGIRIWEGSGHVIEGNFIGTDPTGTLDLGNGIGVNIIGNSSKNTFGGTTPAARNVISGNGGGIAIKSGTDNVIQGNYIGTDASGITALANSSYGVSVTASGNTVGGARPGGSCTGPCNVISSSFGYGVQLSASDNVVQGNFIGTDVTGTVALKNSLTGVDVAGTRMTIGGSGDGEGNIISGNGWGVNLRAGDSHVVRGNYIGTDVTGTLDLGNTNYGIGIAGSNNIIGGTADGARNVISGNNGQGILLSGSGAFGNRLEGNFIGTQADGLSSLGNTLDGVRIIGFTPKDNSIGGTGDGQGNTFAFNGRAGVFVNNGTGHFILGNTIFSNTGLGIDLAPTGVTANDVGDSDSGPNLLQNFPVLSSASIGSTTIEGTLNSTANTRFWIDLFSNTTCDPSGNGEGQVFLGSTVVTTDSSGNGGFTVGLATIVPIGHFITATATDPGKNTSEFSPCVVVAAPTVADLGIDKSDSADPVALGQTLTYTITVTNAGPDEATGVVLTDDLPLDMTFVSASAGCTAVGRTVTCTLGAIPAGGSVVIQIVVLASAIGTQINVAQVSADNDPNDGNNFATENTEVVELADLSITKVDDRDPVSAGERITYNVTVTNLGPNDATGVILTDTLPQGVTFVSVTSTQGTCVHAGDVICDLGTLIAPAVEPPPDPLAIFLPATDVLAQFEFNGDVTDSSGGGRDAVLLGGEFVTAPWGQGLHVFFGGPTGIDWSEFAPLLQHPYTIEMVLNPVDTSSYRKIFSHDDSVDQGWYYHFGGIIDWPNSTVGFGQLLAGERHYIAFVSTALGAVDIYFQGTLLGSTATSFTAPPGEAIFFRDDRAGSEQLDAVVDGLRISGTNRTPEEIAAVQQRLVNQAPTTLLAPAGHMAAPNLGTPVPSDTVIVQIVVTADAAGTLINTAGVASNQTDPVPENNLSTENTVVNPAADLSVTKVDDRDPVLVRESITYTITVTNNGPSDATGVTLTDILPEGVSFVSAPAGCTELLGIVSCDLGTLLSGGSTEVEIVVTANAVGILTNTADVAGSETDPDPANNLITENTTVNPAVDLSLTKVDDRDPVLVGESITYAVTVTNNGPNDATGVILTDTLPLGVSLVSASAGCTELLGIVSCDLGTLLSLGSTVVEIVVTADAVGVLINGASLTANETDPDPTDNTAEETTLATTRTDINRDGRVDSYDLLVLAANLGTSNETGDVNRDGLVDVQDLAAVAADYGRVYR